MDEETLVTRAVEGDETAFEALVMHYEKPVYNLCLRMTGNREDAFDLSQEAFLKAWRSVSLFQGDSKFSTWLYRITSNTCLDHLRKEKRRKHLSLVSLDDQDVSYEREIADYAFDPQRMLECSADAEAVQQAFSKLGEQDRLILSLRAIEDMSYQEIGDLLELKSGTVKSRLSRAREKIRRSFEGNLLSQHTSNKGKEEVQR